MSPQFYRLLWKEYRTQRSLWLVLAFCMVVLQTTFVAVSPPGDDFGAFQPVLPLVSFALIIGYCFLATSVALLFSGEEDQGTAIWLRQFPVRTRTLFWAKAWASLCGASGIIIWGVASAAILIVSRFGEIELSSLNDPALVVFAILPVAIFIVSLFWSLQCRSVFMSLGLSSASVFFGAMLMISSDIEMPLQHAFWPLAIVCLTLYPLAKRWHRGLPNAANAVKRRSVVGRLRRAFAAMIPSSTILRFVGVFMAIPVLAAIGILILVTGFLLPWLFAIVVLSPLVWAFCAMFGFRFAWAAWLKSAACTSPPLKRTVFVLMWRECRFALPFAVVAIAVAVLVTVCRLNLPPHANWGLLALAVVILECGLRTFRYDQQKLHGMFWSHRGVAAIFGVGRSQLCVAGHVADCRHFVCRDRSANGSRSTLDKPRTDHRCLCSGQSDALRFVDERSISPGSESSSHPVCIAGMVAGRLLYQPTVQLLDQEAAVSVLHRSDDIRHFHGVEFVRLIARLASIDCNVADRVGGNGGGAAESPKLDGPPLFVPDWGEAFRVYVDPLVVPLASFSSLANVSVASSRSVAVSE